MKIRYPQCSEHPGRPAYDTKHDAHYCEECNVWLDEGCDDPTCSYCAGRPPIPREVTPSHE